MSTVLSCFLFAQQVDYDFNKKYEIPEYLFSRGDTSWTFPLQQLYTWSFQFSWNDYNSDDGSIKIQIANILEGPYLDYPNLDSLLVDTPADSKMLRDAANGTSGRWFRVVLRTGAGNRGTFRFYGNFIRKNR